MPLHEQELSAGSTGHDTSPQSKQSQPTDGASSLDAKPAIIGIYGIPGSGKTFLLNQLKRVLSATSFNFYEGSEMIANLVPGGLKDFDDMNAQEKMYWRELAIDTIRSQSEASGKTAVVTGHFMFWPEAAKEGCPVYTQNDLGTYTHIIYLDIPIETIEQRRWNDVSRPRPHTSVAHLFKWQQAEKTWLQSLCSEHGILSSILTSDSTLKSKALVLLRDFSIHTEVYNEIQAQVKLDASMASHQSLPDTFLVLDGDRTLAAQDTGSLFWKELFSLRQETSRDPLKSLFSGPLGYSYGAFRQAMLLYEDAVDEENYDTICQRVASQVPVHPEFVSLLQLVAQQEHIGAIVVSCGLRRVWEKVLEREGLLNTVTVIAGGRISDGFVVTAETKAAIVSRLQTLHGAYVWAFGDSPLDLPMLKTADEAIVVVGDEFTRSKSMDSALLAAMDQGGLRARQVTLPCTASPRLNVSKLPVVDLNRIEVISALLHRHDRSARFPIYHATNKSAAKLLATAARDAAVAGPALRKAHRQAGWYLACEFVTKIIGLEDCPISHVLGHGATGFRLLQEQATTIVAIMRAGEPMASGVSQAFPLAMYVHANKPGDLAHHHVQNQNQVVLVDSVINSGKTIVEFVQHIRELDAKTRIVVVAGVVQGQCVSSSSETYKALASCGDISLVTLRISSTKFTGSGTTDTGNRLFNTTHLP
ncbi:hypothetical protein SLS60_003920 [Paraconiothyrium brasiliense]|uniref:Phosphoribosyltransferase domain-containing protein n=1 Tax=Paraconiothyrium brasiliense TaxID=300254 RepID=A0ABR3RQ10_9PLEO